MTRPSKPSDNRQHLNDDEAREALRLEFDIFIMERLSEGWCEAKLARAIEDMVRADADARAEYDRLRLAPDNETASTLPNLPSTSAWPCFLAGALMTAILAAAIWFAWP